jgi:cytochrome c
VAPGVHLTGTSLARIWGRCAGTVDGFTRYSEALRRAAVVWDEHSLDRWLTNPQALVPGNVMTLPGLKDAQQRADLVAYLKAVAAAAVEQSGFRIEADGRRARGGNRLFSARRDGASA